jgi:hypothetical protein
MVLIILYLYVRAHINSYRFMCLCLEKEMMHMRTIARDYESVSSRKKYRHKVLVIQIFSERNLTMRKKFFYLSWYAILTRKRK